MAEDKVKISDDVLGSINGGSILGYQTVYGDSVDSIAKKYNVTREQILKWNNLKETDVLQPNQKIKIKF